MLRKLVAAGALLGLLTVSGAAFSGDGGERVTLVGFDERSQVLVTWDSTNNQISAFQHGNFTTHVPAVLGEINPAIPPDPCLVFMHRYNAQVAHPDHGRALLVTISLMAVARCSATITTDAQGNLLSFQPQH
jgi:hypothetical protein